MLCKKKVRLTKIGVAREAFLKTSSWEDYKIGEVNNGSSIPIDYTLDGYLITEPTLNLPLLIDRIARNGVDERGITRTSKVKQVKKEQENVYRLETENSVYYMEILDVNQED